MKPFLKRILLAFFLLASQSVFAYTTTVNGVTWTYSLSGGNATVEGASPASGALVVPSTLDGFPVASIGERAFDSCSGLTSVTIPDGVTSIGDSAFFDCSGLTSVTIPDSVTSIGQEAFDWCSGLTEVHIFDLAAWCDISFASDSANPCNYAHRLFLNGEEVTNLVIPDGLTSVGDRAFSGCSGLTSVTIPDGVTSIGNYAFSGCSGLTSVTIPDSGTSIGDYAFHNCSGLTSVKIPDSVTSIGAWAFDGCSELTSVTIPNSVTSIGSGSFSDCSGLTSVTIPDSVISIGGFAFHACSGLTSIAIPDSVTSIGVSAFQYCYVLTSITIPDSVTNIGDYAFSECHGFTSITIPDGVTNIGHSVFSGCYLTSITIPDSVTNIGDFAFHCSWLTSVAIPDSVKSIGRSAFDSCNGLTSITIGNSVTNIGDRAFYSCRELSSVTIPDSVTSIGDNAFDGCSGLETLYLPRLYSETPSVPSGCTIVRYDPVSLSVVSEHGGADPSPGTHRVPSNFVVRCSAKASVVDPGNPGVRYGCTGWTGTGSVPASGTSNRVDVLMLEDSSIAWLWETNVWIECAVSGDAALSGTGSRWVRKDNAAIFSFVPASRSVAFRLSGDADGVSVDMEAGTVSIPADRPRMLELHVLSLGEAGEAGGKPLDWTGDAEAPWFAVEDATAPDGFSLRSGEVAQDGTSALETTVTGPGRLSFAWRFSADRNDFVRFYTNGVQQAQIDRLATAWATNEVEIAAGEHSLRWAFERRSQKGGAGFLDDVRWTPLHALTVASAAGTPTPAVGTHDVDWGTEVAASVAPPAPAGGTRRVCTGWTGTGSVPASGTGTNVTFTVEADSSLTWNWRTEHWIDVAVANGGSTSFQPQWATEGSTVSVSLSPDWSLYDIALSGDVTDGVELDGTTLRVLADKPRTIRAAIAERKVSLAVSSAFGTASPAVGAHVHSWGDAVAASVAAPPEADGTRHVCLGWTGTGSVPATGSGTAVSFTMETDSSLAWRWRTDHWISVETAGPVETDFKAGWRAEGETLEVAYDLLFDGECAVTLGGDTNGVALDMSGRVVSIPCDRVRAIRIEAQPAVAEELTLGAALDAPGLVWTSEGGNAWTPQTATTKDGEDAAESGDAAGGMGCESILSTTLTGPGKFSWSWRLETTGNSGIDLEINKALKTSVYSGDAGAWIDGSVDIDDVGTNEVRFVFWNNGSETADRGFVDCVSWTGAVAGSDETSTTPVPVPHAWLVSNGLAAAGALDADFEAAALAPAQNGRPVWECYVAGLDPTKEDDFRAFIDMDGGEPVVTWWPSNVAGRVYTVWGKATLADYWSSPVNPAHHFFQVRVALDGAGADAFEGPVTLTFDPAGGTVDPATRTYDAPGALGQLPVPVREDYVFSGWRTRATGGVEATADTAVPWCDWTLVATWKPALYLVVDLSGGASASSYPVAYLAEPPIGGFNTDEYKMTKLVMRRIEAGTFLMGDDQTDESHRVTLTKPFYCGIFEVTQKQYELVTGSNPSDSEGDKRPVERASWNTIRGNSGTCDWPESADVDPDSFMGRLRARTDLGFDLPTEAQWEYACRAGTTTDYNNGTNYGGNYQNDPNLNLLGRYPHNLSDGKGGYTDKHTTVGSYLSNEWGLYDMHGNVWEWCLDWYGTLSYGTDPKGLSSGENRVLRGGSWGSGADLCTSSCRNNVSPSYVRYSVGFRLVRTLSE